MRPELGVGVAACIDYILVQAGGVLSIPQPLGDARPVEPPEAHRSDAAAAESPSWSSAAKLVNSESPRSEATQ